MNKSEQYMSFIKNICTKHCFYLQITKHNFHVQIINFVTNFTNAAFTYIVNREIFCQLDKYIHNLIITCAY